MSKYWKPRTKWTNLKCLFYIWMKSLKNCWIMAPVLRETSISWTTIWNVKTVSRSWNWTCIILKSLKAIKRVFITITITPIMFLLILAFYLQLIFDFSTFKIFYGMIDTKRSRYTTNPYNNQNRFTHNNHFLGVGYSSKISNRSFKHNFSIFSVDFYRNLNLTLNSLKSLQIVLS